MDYTWFILVFQRKKDEPASYGPASTWQSWDSNPDTCTFKFLPLDARGIELLNPDCDEVYFHIVNFHRNWHGWRRGVEASALSWIQKTGTEKSTSTHSVCGTSVHDIIFLQTSLPHRGDKTLVSQGHCDGCEILAVGMIYELCTLRRQGLLFFLHCLLNSGQIL